jgi:hypothetical protein
VILQVKEYARPCIDNPPNERRSFARKQTIADLEAAGEAAQRVHQLHRALAALDIERD